MDALDPVIKQLLGRKRRPKLPHDLVFVFDSSTNTDQTVQIVKMSARKVFCSLSNKCFLKMFDSSVKRETNPEVRVLVIEPQQFVSLIG